MKNTVFRSAAVALCAVAAFALAAGTASAQKVRSVASLAAAPTADAAQPRPKVQGYLIGADDVLEVFYWRDKDLSADVVVRPDGYISLPLLRDVRALGLTPEALSDHIRERASVYLESPNVTVAVKQINSRKAFITGEVIKPGPYSLTGPMTVLQLISMAGGLTTFANQNGIAIIRAGSAGPVTLRFNYKKALKLKDLDDNITLLPGDTVLVP